MYLSVSHKQNGAHEKRQRVMESYPVWGSCRRRGLEERSAPLWAEAQTFLEASLVSVLGERDEPLMWNKQGEWHYGRYRRCLIVLLTFQLPRVQQNETPAPPHCHQA